MIRSVHSSPYRVTPAARHGEKLSRIAIVCAFAVLTTAGCGVIGEGESPSPTETSRFHVSSAPFWSDEFDGAAGTQPDVNFWNMEVGNREQEGWWNNELQYYTRDAANASETGSGHLEIAARQADEDQRLPCYPSGNCDYTSARLTTEGKVALKYGRADIRATLPTGQGLLPAIWMLGDNGRAWPGQGEIDIVEVVGNEPNTAYGTVHGPTYKNATGIGGSYDLGSSASAGSHVYSIIKEPQKITWLVDDQAYFEVTPRNLPSEKDWVFEQDMHFLLNIAVGGDWPGDPSSSNTFPAKMKVDFIRLYGAGTVNGKEVSGP